MNLIAKTKLGLLQKKTKKKQKQKNKKQKPDTNVTGNDI